MEEVINGGRSHFWLLMYVRGGREGEEVGGGDREDGKENGEEEVSPEMGKLCKPGQ